MYTQTSLIKLFCSSNLLMVQKLVTFPFRSIHMGHCHCKNASLEVYRQARFMKKLMTGSNRSRKKYFTVDHPVSKTFIEMGTTVRGGGPSGAPVKSKKCLRRVEVLNALFMEQITSMMSTGEVSPEVLGLGLTVSKVKISNDFSVVNVYWVATGTSKDDIVESILRKAAGRLRHALTQLRVIGMVPPIEFVKDKTHSKISEVDYLLSKCDFGEDFEPTTPRNLFSQTGSQSLSRQLNEDTDEASAEGSTLVPVDHASAVASTESELYGSISMRQDVLGVRHDIIMMKIKEMVKRVQTKKQGSPNVPERSERDVENDVENENQLVEWPSSESVAFSIRSTCEEVISAKKRQQDFFKYLKKRQLSKSIQLKQLTTEAKEKDFYDDEAFDRWKKHVFNSLDLENPDEQENDDYFEETYYSSNDQFR